MSKPRNNPSSGMTLWIAGVLSTLAVLTLAADLHTPGLGSAIAMHQTTNPTPNPPFGAMRPDTPNPVASLPSSTVPSSTPVFKVRRSRRQGLAGLEIAKDTNKYEHYPTSSVMDSYSVTSNPVGMKVHKREAREHDFMLPVNISFSGQTEAAGKPQKVPSSKRSVDTSGGEGEVASVSDQPTPFHKSEVTLVPVVTAQGSGSSAFVESPNPDEAKKNEKEKNKSKRDTCDSCAEEVTSTTRKRTTEDAGQVLSNQQQGGGVGIITPGPFLGV